MRQTRIVQTRNMTPCSRKNNSNSNSVVTVYVPPLFRRASHQSPLQRNVSALSFLSSQPTCDTNRPLRSRECKQPSQERLSYKSLKPYAIIPTGCMGNGYFLLFYRSSQSKPEGRRIHEHACSCYLSLLR